MERAGERRAQTRIPQRFLVRLSEEDGSRLLYTQDVSDGGVFLRTRVPPSPGTTLRLLIRTHQGNETREGVVVWSRLNLRRPSDAFAASGSGVRFIRAG